MVLMWYLLQQAGTSRHTYMDAQMLPTCHMLAPENPFIVQRVVLSMVKVDSEVAEGRGRLTPALWQLWACSFFFLPGFF